MEQGTLLVLGSVQEHPALGPGKSSGIPREHQAPCTASQSQELCDGGFGTPGSPPGPARSGMDTWIPTGNWEVTGGTGGTSTHLTLPCVNKPPNKSQQVVGGFSSLFSPFPLLFFPISPLFSPIFSSRSHRDLWPSHSPGKPLGTVGCPGSAPGWDFPRWDRF